ncbi:MAG: hypothetical protein HY421_00250 [Candidatus Kerfeldbacteria bacterium]|nr:hypothetical protein [Candidatus Kerfeldbacteria bacterium]
MPHALDRTASYRSRSRQLVLASLRSLAEQSRRGFAGGRAVDFPKSFLKIDQVVMVGMGGSALGSDVIRSVFFDRLKRPLSMVNGYDLPAAVSPRTLVVLSSYSGTTEEVLAVAESARRRRARITGLTIGGALGAWLRRHRLPWYQIDGGANPAGQPRLGLGYSVMGQLGLLSSLGLVSISGRTVARLADYLERRAWGFDIARSKRVNAAKQLAASLRSSLPLLVGAEHLSGSVHAFANQLNETAKTLATPWQLPELNHHLLEGLRYPPAAQRATMVIFSSRLYRSRLVRRVRVTRELVERAGLSASVVPVQGGDRLTEAFDLLVLAGYTSLYLSVLHGVDPLAIPTVNELKRRLGRAGR